jgi:hypothetical protein
MMNPGLFMDGLQGTPGSLLLNLAPASVAAATVREDTVALGPPGPQLGDGGFINFSGVTGVETVSIPGNVRFTAGGFNVAGNVLVQWTNASAGAAVPANGQYRVTWLH